MITSQTESRGIYVGADSGINDSLAVLGQSEVYASETFIESWRRKTGNSAHMIESFFHAGHGVWIGLKEERNLRVHFFAAAVVAGLGIWLKLDALSWTALIMATGLVLVTEFLNTSLEHLVDLASEGRYHRSARYAKDTAAAAVLCASIVAAVIGVIVFLPHLETIIKCH